MGLHGSILFIKCDQIPCDFDDDCKFSIRNFGLKSYICVSFNQCIDLIVLHFESTKLFLSLCLNYFDFPKVCPIMNFLQIWFPAHVYKRVPVQITEQTKHFVIFFFFIQLFVLIKSLYIIQYYKYKYNFLNKNPRNRILEINLKSECKTNENPVD